MANEGMADRHLTAREAAAFLGLSEGTVRNMASEGRLPKVKLGKALRFRLSALEKWIEERNAEATPAAVAVAE